MKVREHSQVKIRSYPVSVEHDGIPRDAFITADSLSRHNLHHVLHLHLWQYFVFGLRSNAMLLDLYMFMSLWNLQKT